jgi:hypothetical protein
VILLEELFKARIKYLFIMVSGEMISWAVLVASSFAAIP